MDIIQNCEVIGFEIVGNKLRKVLTSQGAVVTQKAVMSVAGYSSSLARLAALELPITTMALQAMVTEPVKPVLGVVVMSAAVHAYVSQSDRGEIVIGAGVDTYNSYAQRGGLPQQQAAIGAVALSHSAYPDRSRWGVFRGVGAALAC